MFDSTIIIRQDANALDKLLSIEQHDLGRSSFNQKKNGSQLILEVKAEDAIAFKTVMNTLAKIFIVWEKTKNLEA